MPPGRTERKIVADTNKIDHFSGRPIPRHSALLGHFRSKILPKRRILFHERDLLWFGRCHLQQTQHEPDTLASALKGQRKSAILSLDGKEGLVNDGSCIDFRLHAMNGYSMALFPAEKRPADRVQTRVTGEWPGMQVKCANLRRGQYFP